MEGSPSISQNGTDDLGSRDMSFSPAESSDADMASAPRISENVVSKLIACICKRFALETAAELLWHGGF